LTPIAESDGLGVTGNNREILMKGGCLEG
jgi:hypothetical protein